MSEPFPPTTSRRHAQTVRDSSSSYKIDCVIVMKNFLNPEGHQNPISGSKVTAILLKGGILPIGGASAGEGLLLQPAQQACSHPHLPFSSLSSPILFCSSLSPPPKVYVCICSCNTGPIFHVLLADALL